MIDFQGQTALITGGAQGIGRAIATAFARTGATVIIADINEGQAQDTAAAIGDETGQRVLAWPTDVTDLGSVQRTIAAVIEQTGQIDVLVNNAGWDKFSLFLDTTPDLWHKLIDLNYKGVLNCCYAVLPLMVKQQAGSIVNIASDAGRVGSMGEAVYAGTKGAVIAFSKTIAREMARYNIRVNIVAPGMTETAILDTFYADELGQKVAQAIPKAVPLGRRLGQPHEIAPAVLFLASAAAGFITGQVLSVSGGLTMAD